MGSGLTIGHKGVSALDRYPIVKPDPNAVHWMKLNGKRDNFTREDFYSLEKLSPIFNKRKINQIIEETTEHVSRWDNLATEHGVPH